MNSFRLLTLQKIALNAGLLNAVQEALGNGSTSSPTEPPQPFKVISTVGTGTTVMAPPNCIQPNGAVDFIINIRGIIGGDVKTVSSLGVNAVVITAEGGGIGSLANEQMFGNANFINQAVSSVLASLQKQFPDKNIHRGKLSITSFSGGGGAIAKLLTDRNNIKGGVDSILINDGLHADPGTPQMQAVLDFAKEAEKDPSKKLSIIHTAVDPGKYISTTHTADYLLNQLNLQRQPIQQWNGQGQAPVSEASSGGVKVIQLYDQQQPYMAKDDRGVMRANVMGKTSGGQHISSLQFGLQNLKDLI